MDCNEVRKNLYRWLDKELGPPRSEEMSLHLVLCPDCKKEADFARQLIVTIRTGGEKVGISEDFETVFQQKILDRQQTPRLVNVVRSVGARVPVPNLAQVVGVALVAFFIGGLGGVFWGLRTNPAIGDGQYSYLKILSREQTVPPAALSTHFLKTLLGG